MVGTNILSLTYEVPQVSIHDLLLSTILTSDVPAARTTRAFMQIVLDSLGQLI